MKHLLNETHGIVTSQDSVDMMCEHIADYIYDLNGGLSTTPFYGLDEWQDGSKLRMRDVQKYLRYKDPTYKGNADVPRWLHDFTIIYKADKQAELYSGAFLPTLTKVCINGTLDVTIYLSEIHLHDKTDCISVLQHEFTHAFSKYMNVHKGAYSSKDAYFKITS